MSSAVLRAASDDGSLPREEILDRLRSRSLRTRPLHTLALEAPDFGSFKEAVRAREERYLILSLWSQRALPDALELQTKIRSMLRRARPSVRGCKYWNKAARAISRWECVDYRVGSQRRRLVCIMKLPRPAERSLSGED